MYSDDSFKGHVVCFSYLLHDAVPRQHCSLTIFETVDNVVVFIRFTQKIIDTAGIL